MAKSINFVADGKSWQAGITKVDRDKVYGYVDEEITDINGNKCAMANMLDDGSTLIIQGLTAMKTVDANNQEVDKKALKAVYLDGSDAAIIPSSFDTDVELLDAKMDDLFNLEVTSVYQLSFDDNDQQKTLFDELNSGKLYKFIFNYRSDYEASDAILLANNDGIFVLIGRLLNFEFLENKLVDFVIEMEFEDESDELDFSML